MGAIEDVMGDLGSGKPMDRLICGDVGFGKTEVALRAAFLAAMSGRQVAVVTPTTLLAASISAPSRSASGACRSKSGNCRGLLRRKMPRIRGLAAAGEIDIVVGTHALLSKQVQFSDLGLMVVDEEQRFGVKHKERLKEIKADVHVLTLSATPIPRTLQLALAGIRELTLSRRRRSIACRFAPI